MKRIFRKKIYNPIIFRGDYFIIKHIKLFLNSQLSKYIKKGYKVADVGCGEQPMRNYIELLGGHYVGIDITQNSKKNISIIADITDIPMPNSSFEIILCSEVLEHTPNTYQALKELSRLLKPGGKIIITVPFLYPLHEEPSDFIRITPHQIIDFAKIFSLKILELKRGGNELETLATVWDNMWFRMDWKGWEFLKIFWLGLMRIFGNVLTIIGNIFLKPLLPKKAFMITMCVLTKLQ